MLLLLDYFLDAKHVVWKGMKIIYDQCVEWVGKNFQ